MDLKNFLIEMHDSIKQNLEFDCEPPYNYEFHDELFDKYWIDMANAVTKKYIH